MYLSFQSAALRGRRAGFALRDLAATLCCVGVLFALGCPWLNQARTTSYRVGCRSNMRQVGLGVANHEAATKRHPLVSDAGGPLHTVPPGTYSDDPSQASGYSWLAKILPFIEERLLFDEMKTASDGLQRGPFDPSVTRGYGDAFSTVQIPSLRCPTYSGDTVVNVGLGSEYDELAASLNGGPPAVANYVALVGTHANADGTINENGVIVSSCALDQENCANKGLKLKDVSDGISKTIIACETIEPIYSAWIDGQASWVVGIDPVRAGALDSDGFPTARDVLLGEFSDYYSNVGLYGSKGWPGATAREHGPSSEHGGGVVLHVFADAHVQAISPNIDPTVYYRLITRNGGEPVDTDDL